MTDWLTQETWLAWGVGLLIGFPLLMILFGEMLYRAGDSKRSARSLLKNVQYLVLPSLVIYLLLTKVLEQGADTLGVRIAATVFWIGIIYLLVSAFNLFWLETSDEDSWQSRIPSLVLKIARLFFILFGVAFVMALIWGIDLGQMLAALGVGSIVLGLALQDTLGGLFAGITLISARQFKIGDWIKTGDVVGKVITVNWYSVTLKTFEEDLLVIPNSVLASGTFRNYSRPSRVHMERVIIQFWEEHPPNKVREALLEAARATPGVLNDPPPQVILREIADDAGAYEAMIYFSNYADIDKVRDAYLTHAWYAAKRHGIMFPYEDYQLYHFAGSELDVGSNDKIEIEHLAEKLLELEVLDLAEADLEKLSKQAKIFRYGSGENIIRAGESSESLFIVLTGMAQRFISDHQGQERNLGIAGPGQVFGLIPAIHHRPGMVSTYAKTDLQIARIPFDALEKLLQSDPRLAQKLEQDIETRLENIESLRQRGNLRKGRRTELHPGQDANRVVNLRELLKKK